MTLRDELVARAVALQPLLREHAARTEADRRVPQEVVEAITRAGLFRLGTPRRYGGHEAGMRTLLEVSAALAEGDGSISWVVSLVNACTWVAGLFPVQAQDDVFGADPDARVTGVLAPTATALAVDGGGWRVSGRWYYNSGSWQATWAVLGVPLTDAAGEVVDQAVVLVPREDLQVEDTWFVAGMKGTASNCLVASEVFVPAHRVLSVPAAVAGEFATEQKDEPFYRSGFVPVLALTLVGPQLGLGKAALDHVVANAARKPVANTVYGTQAESVALQLKLAEAALKVETARLHAERTADAIDRAAAQGGYPDPAERAHFRAATAWAVQNTLEAITILLDVHGAGAFAETSPLQRIWRDANTAGRHALAVPTVGYEVYGKSLLGIDDTITPLV
ncbi:acyl-CoA dehydrogenase family protein [Kitasatospora sp. NBC_01250]|uniref:acyl-CoA dehydrogenase family protein n=1 Tax=Kitasatospora sp. NBC_01250 TaxID=2903571 RepID=UPI002E336402|nr:acyl-CoA dehydrogenase family protein [Kitasatospora sp. NBC_01250]